MSHEYKKVRIVMGETASARCLQELARAGWTPEADEQWTGFMNATHQEVAKAEVFILTYARPQKA